MPGPHDDHFLAHHVGLLVGLDSDGQPAREGLPARRLGDGTWELLGTPAVAEGCAAGDVLEVDADSGRFEVRSRGGNVAVVSYAATGATLAGTTDTLALAIQALGGIVETHPDGRWIVVTVPVTGRFTRIEAAMNAWQAETGRDWFYGNVYDADGNPLDWWED